VSNGLTEYDLANVFYHAYLLNCGCFLFRMLYQLHM